MNVLVTGANGQLGQCLIATSENYPSLKFIFKNSKELDITNPRQIDAVFSSNNIQYCINCAAYTAVDQAEKEQEKAFLINATAVKNLAEACKIYGVILIHVSTDFVFDGHKNRPYTEADSTNPINVYGASKLKGEQYIQSILPQHFIIRTSWLYSEFNANFVKTMLRLSAEKTELNVVDDQLGTPTYAKDLAQAILQIVSSKSQVFGLYHYSNEGVVSWCGFAQEIFRLSKFDVRVNPIDTGQYPTPAKRPKYSVLSKTKIKETFGFPIHDWKVSLATVIDKLSPIT